MQKEIDLLERRLLELGSTELALERDIRELLLQTREAAAAGNAMASEQAWTLHQELKAGLASLRHSIAAVEIRLYGLRRKLTK